EGAASLALGSLGGAAEAQEQALWLFRQLGDGVGEARALASIANRHQRAGRNAEALEWNRKSLAVAAAAGHAQAHAVAAGATASSLLVLADSDPSLLEPAVEALQQAIAQLRSVGDRRGEGLYLSNLGLARRYTAPAEALTHYEDALVLLREGGARVAEGVALKAMADLQRRQGRLAEARPLLELALRIHREMGTRSSEGHLLLSLAALESQLGRGEEALALNRRALEIVRETGNVGVEPMVLANIGALSTTLGRADAGAEVERAIAVSEARGDRLIEGYARMFLAVVRAREGRSSDAWAELDRSESALAGLHHPVVDGHGHLCRAEIAWLTGDPDGARASLAAAEGFGVSDLDRDIARVRALLD
ncbi:MAG: tetratricopeptide repeat protein, partial [Myxococcales bacterium]|nr:tetratricopeptide repeat protein [Myxococcales bacterium]